VGHHIQIVCGIHTYCPGGPPNAEHAACATHKVCSATAHLYLSVCSCDANLQLGAFVVWPAAPLRTKNSSSSTPVLTPFACSKESSRVDLDFTYLLCFPPMRRLASNQTEITRHHIHTRLLSFCEPTICSHESEHTCNQDKGTSINMSSPVLPYQGLKRLRSALSPVALCSEENAQQHASQRASQCARQSADPSPTTSNGWKSPEEPLFVNAVAESGGHSAGMGLDSAPAHQYTPA
jgi:hypothetical protein